MFLVYIFILNHCYLFMSKKLTTKEFIEKAELIHGKGKYDYSLVEYDGQDSYVDIRCIHHDKIFRLQAKNHIVRPRGCPTCHKSDRDIIRTKEFIHDCNIAHKNKYDYSLVKTIFMRKNMSVICPEHGIFSITPAIHRTGCGTCPNCDRPNQLAISQLKYDKFIKMSIEKHGDKYGYDNVKLINLKDRVEIICPIHKSYLQQAHIHASGVGCPKCGIELTASKKYKTTEDFIERSKLIHGDRYDYSLVKYVKCDKPVDIICKVHGIFSQTPQGHWSGRNCTKCSNTGLSNTEDFIKKAIEVHGLKYDYHKVKYVKAKEKVTIICKSHGEFSMTPNKHISCSQGCRKCHDEINQTGWGVTLWEEKEFNSKHFVAFEVYVIRCFNNIENFYKIGRTSVGIKRRFNSTKDMPYEYEVLKMFNGTARDMYNFENKLQKSNKLNKYEPLLNFGGQHECFIKLMDIDGINYGDI